MNTAEVQIQPPQALVDAVMHLKRHFPYRICWGAFRPENPADCCQNASYDKRQFNAKLRAGYVGFAI